MDGMRRARPGSGPSLRRTKRARGSVPLILLPLLAVVAVFGPSGAAQGSSVPVKHSSVKPRTRFTISIAVSLRGGECSAAFRFGAYPGS